MKKQVPLTLRDMERLYKKVSRLIRKEVGVDDDGNVRVSFNLVNRETHQVLHFSPIPHNFEPKTEEEANQIERALDLNLSIATDSIQMYLRMRANAFGFRQRNMIILASKPAFFRWCKKHNITATIGEFVKWLQGEHHINITSYDLLRVVDSFNGGQGKTVRIEGGLNKYLMIEDKKNVSSVKK